MDTGVYNTRIQLELMHEPNVPCHPAPPDGEPDAKNPKFPENLPTKTKQRKARIGRIYNQRGKGHEALPRVRL